MSSLPERASCFIRFASSWDSRSWCLFFRYSTASAPFLYSASFSLTAERREAIAPLAFIISAVNCFVSAVNFILASLRAAISLSFSCYHARQPAVVGGFIFHNSFNRDDICIPEHILVNAEDLHVVGVVVLDLFESEFWDSNLRGIFYAFPGLFEGIGEAVFFPLVPKSFSRMLPTASISAGMSSRNSSSVSMSSCLSSITIAVT